MKIESALSAAKNSRYYVTAYTAALASEKLEDQIFADMGAQQAYFTRKLQDVKRDLRDSLFGGRAELAADLRRVTGEEKHEIETAIAGIDAELATLSTK